MQAAKRPHSLHTCKDERGFLESFRDQAGETIEDVIARFAVADLVAGCVLGGSIPLGVATSVSDVDLIVVVDDGSALRRRTAGDPSAVEVSGEFIEDADTLMVAETVAIAGGIELNLQFVVMSRLQELTRRLARSGVWVSLAGQATILGRLKTGWLLLSSDRFVPVYTALRNNNSLEIHCTVRYFVFALQYLEDARAALTTHDLELAPHLGRMCVETCFLAYLASLGCVSPGSKWFRLLNASRDGNSVRQTASRLWSLGMPLLFPTVPRTGDQVVTQLRDVAKFAQNVREAIEERTAFKVAFKLCPQIHDPTE